MNVRARVAAFCAGLLAGGLPLAAPAQTTPAPLRTLIYSFETRAGQTANPLANTSASIANEISPDDCLTGGLKMAGKASSSIAAGNGGLDFFQVDCRAGFGYQLGATGQPDRGSIQVRVVRQQSDRGLVVQLGERSNQRSSAPATCVVYPSTDLICDPNVQVSLEEVTLLRFLAPHFVDPSSPNDRHWQVADESPQSSFQATYTILQDADGILRIGERRIAKGMAGPHSTAASSSTIVYDAARDVPTVIDENLVQKSVRYGQYRTTERETIFALQPPASPARPAEQAGRPGQRE